MPRFHGCRAPSASDEGRVGDDQLGVDHPLEAEAVAAVAGAVGRVEGEDPRLQLGDRGAAVEAGELLGEDQRLGLRVVDHLDLDQPGGEPGGGLDRLREAPAQVRFHHQPVDDDRDVVFVLLVEDDLLVEPAQLAVDLGPRVALEPHLLEQFPVLAFAPAHDRRHHHEFGPVLDRHQPVDDLLLRLAGDRLAAVGAVRHARSAPRAGAGSRRSRSPCRPSSAGCARSSSGRSRSPARAPRSSRRRASPSGRGTGARRPRATRRSGAGPRRRSCRRQGSTCRSPRAR